MNSKKAFLLDTLKTAIGCSIFAVGFNMFMEPCGVNAGGIAGLAMVLEHILGFGSVGIMTFLINVPLFAIAGIKVGKKFFIGSFIGMAFISLSLDLFVALPAPPMEPLLGAIYGGAIAGVGLGMVFAAGMSTGGSDIVIRLLKLKWQYIPIGMISIAFDAVVAVLTGIVFQDLTKTLYSGVAIFVTGKVIDVVVYSFDYSKVAWIISGQYEKIAKEVGEKLHRGATYLHGEGSYSGREKKVILTAVKKQQIAELKQIVVDIDPDAFIIVQEAHQVLGDGFLRYTKDSL